MRVSRLPRGRPGCGDIRPGLPEWREKTKRRGGEAERSPRRGKLNMTDDPLEKLRGLFCGYCMGTGYMELVMADLSREPWPCLYCEAGRRVRDERDGRESNADSPDGAD